MRPHAKRSPRAVLLGGLLIAAFVPGAGASARVIDPALVFPVAGSAYRSVHAPHCSLKGARTVVANATVRIFNARYPKYGRLTFGCRRSADRAFVLGIVGECQNNDVIDTAVVAGTLAALNVHTCGLATSESEIALVDLRTGRVAFASAPLSLPPTYDGYDAIRGMAVTAAGRLAWLAVRIVGGHVVAVEVRRRARDPNGPPVLLDSSTDIDPRSLRRNRSMLIWHHGEIVRSAAM
jgi:hypothetical protein